MVKLPKTIFSALNGRTLTEEYILRVFAYEGYGRRRTRSWIREFVGNGWIEKNDDGTYKIAVPSLTSSAHN